MLQQREAGGFIPYLNERDAFGRLIRAEEPEEERRREVINEDGEVIDFDDGNGPLWREQMRDAAAILGSLDLHQQIRDKAAQKRRDPRRGSTHANRLKIEKNVKMRIKNQIEFSKHHSLMEATDEEGTEDPAPAMVVRDSVAHPASDVSQTLFAK